MKTDVWGKHMWYSIHFIALGFPEYDEDAKTPPFAELAAAVFGESPSNMPDAAFSEATRDQVVNEAQLPVPVDVDNKANYRNFFENLQTVLPRCEFCVDYVKNFNQMPIQLDTLEDAERLFRWTVDIHNSVNAEIGGRLWTYEEAFKFYVLDMCWDWGKHMWYSIHFIALAFPENPTNEDKRNYQYFFENLHTVLPCPHCSANYIKHLTQMPIHVDILENAEGLFRWTVDMHNLVNAELGKRLWTHEEAFKFYAID